MKLVLINTLYPPLAVGGAERVVQTLARLLVRGGDEVTVLCLTDADSGTEDFDEGVKIIRVPLRNIYWPFGKQAQAPARLLWHMIDSFNPEAARTVERVLRSESPDVVHTHNLAGFSTRAWSAVKKLGLPLVHTLHDYYLLCPRSTMHRSTGNCASLCTSCSTLSWPRRSASSMVDSVAGVSEYVLRRHEAEGLFSDRTTRHVVHNGLTHVEIPRAAKTPATRPSNAVLRIGYMGRIEANKGVDFLLQATAGMEAGSWQMVVAGKGDDVYMAELRARHPSPAITYLGISSLKDFFEQVDLLVVPSLWNEPLGMVAFEAYFYGVPVVASRRGGLTEIVTPETGVLFEPDAPRSLATVLTSLQGDPSRLAALAEGARRAAVQFEPERMRDSYCSIYRRVVAVRPETGATVV